MMFIGSDLYAQIVRSLPIICVDLILKISDTDNYVLVQRREEPLQGVMWPPGGRKRLGETLIEAAQRIATTELTVPSKAIIFERKPIGLYHDMFENSSFGQHRYETFSLLMRGRISKTDVAFMRTDYTSERVVIDKSIPERMLHNTLFFKEESL